MSPMGVNPAAGNAIAVLLVGEFHRIDVGRRLSVVEFAVDEGPVGWDHHLGLGPGRAG